MNQRDRDLGTPELARKRAALVGDGDPAMSSLPLGVYLERGLLHHDYDVARRMFDAGMHYRYCYGVVFGRSSVRAITDMPNGRNENIDELLEEIEPAYWRLARAIANPRQVFSAVWQVCIHDQFVGRWDLEQLKTGLARLGRA